MARQRSRRPPDRAGGHEPAQPARPLGTSPRRSPGDPPRSPIRVAGRHPTAGPRGTSPQVAGGVRERRGGGWRRAGLPGRGRRSRPTWPSAADTWIEQSWGADLRIMWPAHEPEWCSEDANHFMSNPDGDDPPRSMRGGLMAGVHGPARRSGPGRGRRSQVEHPPDRRPDSRPRPPVSPSAPTWRARRASPRSSGSPMRMVVGRQTCSGLPGRRG